MMIYNLNMAKYELFSPSEIKRLKQAKTHEEQLKVLDQIGKELVESEEYKNSPKLTKEEENSLRAFANLLLDRAYEEVAKEKVKGKN